MHSPTSFLHYQAAHFQPLSHDIDYHPRVVVRGFAELGQVEHGEPARELYGLSAKQSLSVHYQLNLCVYVQSCMLYMCMLTGYTDIHVWCIIVFAYTHTVIHCPDPQVKTK